MWNNAPLFCNFWCPPSHLLGGLNGSKIMFVCMQEALMHYAPPFSWLWTLNDLFNWQKFHSDFSCFVVQCPKSRLIFILSCQKSQFCPNLRRYFINNWISELTNCPNLIFSQLEWVKFTIYQFLIGKNSNSDGN